MRQLFLALRAELRIPVTCEDGWSLVEYALIASSIALALIAGVPKIAGAVTFVFDNLSASIPWLAKG